VRGADGHDPLVVYDPGHGLELEEVGIDLVLGCSVGDVFECEGRMGTIRWPFTTRDMGSCARLEEVGIDLVPDAQSATC
jgi:hypothetical protein